MTVFQAKLERFETLATECDSIADRAADGSRREAYLRLGARYRELAGDMRSVIAAIEAAA
ncbi:hypothetical protein [Bradyrhizobium jicamae]|uniref:hypothetical protein n=1 Tax=Bradyrhizobium jicamae TaxID=280332 RepID=UPI001BA45810|nr:hypothetical protein [Bradyrhizobium jicamae]MBR0936243.1 hypothetical protein [Bradyrhizobium jicamae]